jgi:hypothetical protein
MRTFVPRPGPRTCDPGVATIQASRRGLERTLDMALWLETYQPDIRWS